MQASTMKTPEYPVEHVCSIRSVGISTTTATTATTTTTLTLTNKLLNEWRYAEMTRPQRAVPTSYVVVAQNHELDADITPLQLHCGTLW